MSTDSQDVYETTQEDYAASLSVPKGPLRSSRVTLTSFDPSKHTSLLWKGLAPNGTIDSDDIKWTGWSSKKDVKRYVESYERNPGVSAFAILTKDTDGQEVVAGLTGYHIWSNEDMSTNVMMIVVPKFRRTHVTTHCAGVLLHKALDTLEQGGRGMRRVIWTARPDNERSHITATRLGFKRDEALEGESSSDAIKPSVSSVTSDDWVNGVRDHVDQLMSKEYATRSEEH